MLRQVPEAVWKCGAMQLAPRYGTDPILTLDGDPAVIADPAIRQRRRLVQVLGSLTAEQWDHPSRCEGWSVRDVVVHLESTNPFWAASIAAGLRGDPTRFLATFDPVSSPAQLVAGSTAGWREILDRFTASTEALVDLWASLDATQWTALAEAPPGHISVSAVTHHALWDAWVHERDILLPLGIAPDEEPDEVTVCLRYAVALAPALDRCRGVTREGVLGLRTTSPEVKAVVAIADNVSVRAGDGPADLVLTGESVEVLEALSVRAALVQPIPPSSAWMVSGLAETFDVATD
ncbi:MAG TPA: maleylpyruvate isomerase family mycothiol-dependent enzyme [Acidimicrobiales bacterium]